MCTDEEDEEPRLQNEGEVNCWKYNGGYKPEDIYSSLTFTSMNDCRDKCLADKNCVGVHTTQFHKIPKKCELAKQGAMTQSRDTPFYFGATRKCFEENPQSNCADHWTDDRTGNTRCDGYKRMCNSRCPTWVRLMTSVCRKTCEFCTEDEKKEDDEDKEDEEDKEDKEEGEDDEEDEDKMETTWTRMKGKKAKGKKLAKNMDREAAKKKCCEMGDKCAGISCKGKKKCDVMADISKTAEHEKYNIFAKKSQ